MFIYPNKNSKVMNPNIHGACGFTQEIGDDLHKIRCDTSRTETNVCIAHNSLKFFELSLYELLESVTDVGPIKHKEDEAGVCEACNLVKTVDLSFERLKSSTRSLASHVDVCCVSIRGIRFDVEAIGNLKRRHNFCEVCDLVRAVRSKILEALNGMKRVQQNPPSPAGRGGYRTLRYTLKDGKEPFFKVRRYISNILLNVKISDNTMTDIRGILRDSTSMIDDAVRGHHNNA